MDQAEVAPPTTVELFLDDAELSRLMGIPEKKKIINPFYHATELDREGKHKEAERIYLELMNVDFENPVLWAALGMNYAQKGKNGLAYLLMNSALSRMDNMMSGFKKLGIIPKGQDAKSEAEFIRVKTSELNNAIGTCYKHENRTVEARRHFDYAQSLVAPNSDIQSNMGTLYINEGDPEKALKHLDEAVRLEPDHAQAHWNRSLALLELGRYRKGWTEYDWGERAQTRLKREFTKAPLAYWEGQKGKKVVVYGEQGIGDEIMFASCLRDLIADSELVVFDCHRKLHRLFAASFPTIDIYPTREDEMITWPLKPDGTPRYEFDYKVSIGSLPKFYRNELEDFPGETYLNPTEESEKRWQAKLASLGSKPKIGISWIGGHKRTRMEVRSIELEALLPILKQDATFISLQYTPAEADIEALEKKHGIKIHHWPEACYSADYNDTAGLVANLDLVITVCTSLVHLCGAMGVPCWVMTPSRPAWRYKIEGNDMPWYQSVLLFRQARDSTGWLPVIAEVAGHLTQMLSAIKPETEAA